MKRIILLLLFYGIFSGLYAQEDPFYPRNNRKNRKRANSFLGFGFEGGRLLTQESPFDRWLSADGYPNFAQAKLWNLAYSNALMIHGFYFAWDMGLTTPFSYGISPLQVRLGFHTGYGIYAFSRGVIYLAAGISYQNLTIDFKGNTPFDLAIVPMPHDKSRLEKSYMGLHTTLNLNLRLGEAGSLIFRAGYDYMAIATDWKYGYYVSNKNRTFRGIYPKNIPESFLDNFYVGVGLMLSIHD